MKGIDSNSRLDIRDLKITKLKQVSEDLLEIVVSGDVESRLAGVVPQRHERSDSVVAILRFSLEECPEGLEIAGSDDGEESVVREDSEGLGIHWKKIQS